MSDERQPIPQALAQAFHDALANYHDWRPGEPEPTVSFEQRAYSISFLCGLVTKYSGSMPAALASLLAKEIHLEIEHFDLKADSSYEIGARCLLALIKHRREEYELRARHRN
jgi:hypothetical protein